jgi:hypothetical protein
LELTWPILGLVVGFVDAGEPRATVALEVASPAAAAAAPPPAEEPDTDFIGGKTRGFGEGIGGYPLGLRGQSVAVVRANGQARVASQGVSVHDVERTELMWEMSAMYER